MASMKGNGLSIEWDLSQVASRRLGRNKSMAIGGGVAAAILIGGTIVDLYFLASEARGLAGYQYFGAAAAILLGGLFAWQSLRTAQSGATRIRVDAVGLTLWYPRNRGEPQLIRWDSPRFRFVMRRDAAPGIDGEGFCLAPAVRRPSSQLSDAAFFGILRAAREFGAAVEERKVFRGYRTVVRIGPRAA